VQSALIVEADPAGFGGDLFLSSIGKTVHHGHVAAGHRMRF
jgi:hypothetical protein